MGGDHGKNGVGLLCFCLNSSQSFSGAKDNWEMIPVKPSYLKKDWEKDKEQ